MPSPSPPASPASSGARPQTQQTVDADRWTAVEDELRAMLNGVAAANLVRRHRIGLTALQTYNICRQLVRQKEHAALLPPVQGMKRLNKFGKKHAKAAGGGAAAGDGGAVGGIGSRGLQGKPGVPRGRSAFLSTGRRDAAHTAAGTAARLPLGAMIASRRGR